MRVKPLNLNYLNILKFIFFICLFLVAALIVYFPNFAKLSKLRNANQKLELQVKSLKKEIKDLHGKIKKIGKDPSLYEKLARENLGVAKENEIVVDIRE